MYRIVTTLLVLCASLQLGKGQTRHPCDRECEWPPAPKTCEYEFTVEWYYIMSIACYNCPYNITDCSRPHCVAANGVSRPVITVNRQLPGPAIKVCQNDTISVIVHNELENEEGLTIHWHGLYVSSTPYMDGVPMLTQCAIPTHTSFKYEFRADPPGSHWWHAHSGLQRADGFAGPLIVNQPKRNDPHRNLYTSSLDDHIVFVSDWKHEVMLAEFQAYHYSTAAFKGQSWLINGKGQFKDFVNATTNVTYFTPREVFKVERGKSYRFRTISNGFSYCPYAISVDGHRLTVIASDGADVQPREFTNITVHGGERFDFIVNATNNVSNYWINIYGLGNCYAQHHKAILRYDGASEEEPENTVKVPGNFSMLNPGNTPGNEMLTLISKLEPKYSSAYPEIENYKGTPDQTHFIGWDFMKVDNPKFHHPDFYPANKFDGEELQMTPQFNNVTFSKTDSPMLTQPDLIKEEDLCNPDSSTWNQTRFCKRGFCSCPYVIDVGIGNLVELVLYDEGRTENAGHSMHLHGHHFAIVAMGKLGSILPSEIIKEMHSNGSITRNFNAPLKDTMVVPDGGYAVVRFIANHPGIWFFHCHIVFDSVKGMELAFRVGKPKDWPAAPKNFPKCGSVTNFEWDENVAQRQSHSYYLLILLFVVLYAFG